ncbi:hypothetical protein TNCV_3143881 [Trichonephila clavipes]|nr:hypothetical protein TNCV_3143881 [Trichonephila clavipes]
MTRLDYNFRLLHDLCRGISKKKEHRRSLSGYPESLRPRVAYRINLQAHHVQHSPTPYLPTPLVQLRSLLSGSSQGYAFKHEKYSLRSSSGRMGGKVKNHMNENGSNQEDSPAKRGGRTFPETRNALSMQSAGGGGEERRKAVGTAESSKSKQ